MNEEYLKSMSNIKLLEQSFSEQIKQISNLHTALSEDHINILNDILQRMDKIEKTYISLNSDLINENIKNMMVLTGSIPNQFNANKTFKSYVYKNKEIEMNIPKFMYKILLFTDPKNYPNNIFHICILVKNKPQYISNKLKNFDISRYITTINNLGNLINLDITKIINYYKIKNNLHQHMDLISFNYYQNNKKKYSSLKQNLMFYINPFLNTQMEKSYYYGKLIYSQSLEELNRYWKQVEQRTLKFNDISFHKQYYDLAYQRLINNKNN